MSTQTIVLGGGCFWCVEAVLKTIKGIVSLRSGYAGGEHPAPDYDAVCSGVTGHAEVVEVVFDDSVIDLSDLLMIFFTLHDPTTPNRQGNDIGSQYRSIILYSDNGQRQVAESVIKTLTDEAVFQQAIVTELQPLQQFFPAEDYHQNYFANNPGNPYCQFSIPPKNRKVVARFADFVKD